MIFQNDDQVVKNWKVRTGSSRISRGGVISDVSKIVVHPQWDPQNVMFDFALVQLKSSLRLNDQTKVINLPVAGYEMTDGTQVLACGHGSTQNPLHSQELFRAIVLTVANFDDCKAAWGGKDGPFICVTSPTKEQSVCFGDSGGPLEEVKSGNLVGVTSFAATGTCVETGETKAGFAKVSAVRPWIKKIAGV